MSLEEYKSSLDMFAMKTQDITAKMNGITNETLKAEYSKELDNIKKEKEEVTKLIAEDKKDRKAINGQLKKVKSEIIGSRNNIKTLRLEAKKAEDLVASSIMSQTGQESVCEKKKIQAQQKQIEAEKNEKKVNGENEKIKSQITEKELKMAAHELNQKESEEVIESLNKRKASVEADAAAGNKDQVL
jgi:chromosome segregation ATPase